MLMGQDKTDKRQDICSTWRREKPTEMSFLGLRERCQYWVVDTGLGSTAPAVYAACQMLVKLTRRVISWTHNMTARDSGTCMHIARV